VYEVKVRPRNDRLPAAVGALYLARDDAQVVRMAFSFTRSALKDRQLEDVSIILENSLIEERFWLPRRQEIEIRRTGSWMDFPVKGIIRGRWEIRDYKVNAGGTVAVSPGPEIMYAPAERRAAHAFPSTAILDSLPDDVTLVTDDDVRVVQEEARRLVRAQALARARQTLPSARSFSDIVQVNRVEGLSIGGGVRRRLGAGIDIAVNARIGVADEVAKASASLGWERANGLSIRARLFRDFREAGDEAETSRARNSIAAQEFGTDDTQPFGVRGGAITISGRARDSWRWNLEAGAEAHRALEVHAVPSRGRFEPTLPADHGDARRLSLRVERPMAPWLAGIDLRLRSDLRFTRFTAEAPATSLASTTVARAFAAVEMSKRLARATLVGRLGGGGVWGSDGIPRQEALFAGGPLTGPGYGFHEFQGTGLATGRLELRHPAPFFPVPLGRWGRVPAAMTLAPYLGVVQVSGRAPGIGDDGPHLFVGIGALTFFELLRFDVARGLKGGRWRFALDVTRDFWPIL
ncbi:MAG: hypothetical protein ACT4P7_09275, partial [Gemmatimonadaceae bacterium]